MLVVYQPPYHHGQRFRISRILDMSHCFVSHSTLVWLSNLQGHSLCTPIQFVTVVFLPAFLPHVVINIMKSSAAIRNLIYCQTYLSYVPTLCSYRHPMFWHYGILDDRIMADASP